MNRAHEVTRTIYCNSLPDTHLRKGGGVICAPMPCELDGVYGIYCVPLEAILCNHCKYILCDCGMVNTDFMTFYQTSRPTTSRPCSWKGIFALSCRFTFCFRCLKQISTKCMHSPRASQTISKVSTRVSTILLPRVKVPSDTKAYLRSPLLFKWSCYCLKK